MTNYLKLESKLLHFQTNWKLSFRTTELVFWLRSKSDFQGPAILTSTEREVFQNLRTERKEKQAEILCNVPLSFTAFLSSHTLILSGLHEMILDSSLSSCPSLQINIPIVLTKL